MPNLVRLIVALGVIFGVFYGGLYLAAEYLDPEPREIRQSIGKIKLDK